jgi:hypothetical protein
MSAPEIARVARGQREFAPQEPEHRVARVRLAVRGQQAGGVRLGIG